MMMFQKIIVLSGVILYASMAMTAETSNDTLTHKDPISPIPEVTGLDPDKVSLGRRLFHDPKLSSDGTVSCASCHSLNNAGVDGLPISIGVKGLLGTRNAPTVLNSSLLFRQFWDGRAATLEEQVSGPLTNPVEMATNWPDVVAYLQADARYAMVFDAIYKQSPTKESAANAIAEFERSLLTPNGDFDRYLKGDNDAIDEQAKQGYRYFKMYGCASCHQGVAVGGNLYEKLGIVKPYYGVIRKPTESDLGRYLLTGEDEQKFEFKVPSLRNVARTAPYLHDGSIATLEETIAIMAEYQLGRELPVQHIADIVRFLQTLNGDVDED